MKRQNIQLLACCAVLPAILVLAPRIAFRHQAAGLALQKFSTSPFAGKAEQDTAAASVKYFVAIFSLGEKWQVDKAAPEQPFFKEHSANLQRLRQEKKIMLGARYADKGMLILCARDDAQARSWLENDPMVVNRLFDLEVHPFNPFYFGCIEKK